MVKTAGADSSDRLTPLRIRAIDILREEIDRVMALIGVRSVAELDRDRDCMHFND